MKPPEDAQGEREYCHQQHAHVLAALLQPTHPDTLVLTPTPARNLPHPYPNTLVPHGILPQGVEGLQQEQDHAE